MKLQKFLKKSFRHSPSPSTDLNPFAGYLSADHDPSIRSNNPKRPAASPAIPSSRSSTSSTATSPSNSRPSSPATRTPPSLVSSPVASVGPLKRSSVDELFELENDKLIEAFKIIDINGDGKISEHELGLMWKRLGKKISDKELKLMIREADTNGDGELDLEEFVAFHSKMLVHPEIDNPAQHAEDVRVAFAVSDLCRDGLISAAELQTVMKRLGKRKVTATECAAMIRWVDSDGDSLITFAEFEKLMMSSIFARKY